MRAFAKILRARESEHPCNFCEQFEKRPSFAITFKLSGTIRHPYVNFAIFRLAYFTGEGMLVGKF